MKAFMTPLTLIAVLLYSGATPLRCQEPPPPSTPAERAALQQDEQESARALAEVERQVQAELAPKLEEAAVEAAVTRQEARRQMAEHMAKAREAIELAQAAAPVAPAALAPGLGAPSPAIELRGLQNRLQHIVHRGQASQGKALVIRTSDADAKGQGNLEEDLAVMSRIFDKTLAQKLDEDRQNRYMGINVLFGPGSSPIRSIYLEGYGALFLLNVNFPLLPPPEKAEQTKEKSEPDSTWEEARREIYGQHDAWSQVGKAFKFSMAGGPEQEYDEKKVEDLQEGLLEALKNATNIRNLKPDETLTVCVFGGASAGPRKARTVRASPKPAPDAPEEEVFVSIRDDGVPARGTIMTIRVKKSDADGFAKGELNADEFRKRASITTYAGDTGGWGGGNAFGGLAAP